MVSVKEKREIYNHIRTRFQKLIIFDDIRLYKLLEIIQYAFLYALVTIPLSAFIENMFPKADPYEKWWIIFIEVILQLIIVAVFVYYIQKIVKIAPFIFGNGSGYQKYRTFEYRGTITIGLIFVGTQMNLINKIDILKRRIFDHVKAFFDRKSNN